MVHWYIPLTDADMDSARNDSLVLTFERSCAGTCMPLEDAVPMSVRTDCGPSAIVELPPLSLSLLPKDFLLPILPRLFLLAPEASKSRHRLRKPRCPTVSTCTYDSHSFRTILTAPNWVMPTYYKLLMVNTLDSGEQLDIENTSRHPLQ